MSAHFATLARMDDLSDAEALALKVKFADQHRDWDEWLYQTIYAQVRDDEAEARDTARNAA